MKYTVNVCCLFAQLIHHNTYDLYFRHRRERSVKIINMFAYEQFVCLK